jgi:dihydrofolate reductase
MKISMVVAASENNAIGLNGRLLWNLPKDMQFFKNITLGHQVLMGRKSWDALPPKFRPLPGRPNIVVTRQPGFVARDSKVVSTIEEGVAFAKNDGEKELMIIGGGEIYRQALPITDKVYLTRVHHTFDNADAFFPVLNPKEWKQTGMEKHYPDEKHQYAFDFLVYERR